MRRYLLIDGLSLTHAAQGAAPLKVGSTEVQAIYGFLRTMRALVSTYVTATPIVLWDGASWRNMTYPDYKADRERDHTPAYKKAQEEKKKAKACLPAIQKMMTALGISQVKAANMEADDLAAILGDRYAARGDKVLLISGDKDWVQLVGPGIGWFDPIRERKIYKPEDVETVLGFKVETMRQFVEMKCLVGDAGDSVPGVGGIGPAGAQELLSRWGSFKAFLNDAVVTMTKEEFNRLPKKFRALVEDEEKALRFEQNLELMDLRTPKRPAPVNLTVTKGEPDLERFRKLCQTLAFQSILKDLDNWTSVFEAFRPPWDEAA